MLKEFNAKEQGMRNSIGTLQRILVSRPKCTASRNSAHDVPKNED